MDYVPFHRKGMSSFSLTNSMIFQDSHIAPPTSDGNWIRGIIPNHNYLDAPNTNKKGVEVYRLGGKHG